MGGEKLGKISAPNIGQGSPPRRRGKDAVIALGRHTHRITPAWAGKSSWTKAISTRTLDHPRMGGEKPSQKGCGSCPAGSPPRGQGKGRRIVPNVEGLRITPAWAGKSRTRHRPGHRCRDHPRVGGEKRARVLHRPDIVGSPPHGRGKDFMFCGQHLEIRITPAWAGKSPASQPWSPPLWMMVIRPRP